jgi:hypothetical protein
VDLNSRRLPAWSSHDSPAQDHGLFLYGPRLLRLRDQTRDGSFDPFSQLVDGLELRAP